MNGFSTSSRQTFILISSRVFPCEQHTTINSLSRHILYCSTFLSPSRSFAFPSTQDSTKIIRDAAKCFPFFPSFFRYFQGKTARLFGWEKTARGGKGGPNSDPFWWRFFYDAYFNILKTMTRDEASHEMGWLLFLVRAKSISWDV